MADAQQHAVITATLGGLAAPPGAHAMLPADAGGGGVRRPTTRASRRRRPRHRRPATPPSRSSVTRRPHPRRTAPSAPGRPAANPGPRRPPGPARRPARPRRPEPGPHAHWPVRGRTGPPAAGRRAPTRRAARQGGAAAQRRASAVRREPRAPGAAASATPPRPRPSPSPSAPTGEQVRSEAERYANALDQIEADDGALRDGHVAGHAAGRRPARRAAREGRSASARPPRSRPGSERQRQQDRKAAEDARVLRESQAYMNAQERIKDNGGAMNMGLSRALSYGDDPKVKAFVTEFRAPDGQREQDAREREERASRPAQGRDLPEHAGPDRAATTAR